MAAKLVAENGILKGLVLNLEEGNQWLIGRDPDQCQLLVEDPTASRKHLVCRNTPEGIIAENLSDTNPVEVNDQKLSEPRVLQQGDTVKIGSGIFRFYSGVEVQNANETSGDKEKMKNDQDQKIEENILAAENQAPTSPIEENILATENQAPAIGESTEEVVEELDQQTKEQPGTQGYNDDQERDDSIFEESPQAERADDLANVDFDFLEAGRWFIKVISGPNTGAEFSMQSGTSYVIGTDPSTCDVVFHDASVSRQHARINVGKEDVVSIEDLKSRNGTVIDDEKLTESRVIPSNTVITLGTTSFVVLDREGKRDTIISPLLPSIVKVLQRDEARKAEELAARSGQVPVQTTNEVAPPKEEEIPHERSHTHYTALILIAMVTGILVIAGIGTTTLFNSKTIEAPQVNVKDRLDQVFSAFPSVKYSFNKTNGRLLIVGHVLTPVDRTQLLYNLQELNFIKSIDSNIIIDEYVWQEANQVISKSPDWRGITIHSPSPGRFVLTGYLKTRKQADQLSDYLSQNFQYLDLLEKRITVEEDVLTQINVDLQDQGIRGIAVQMNNGEVSLSGAVGGDKTKDLEKVITQIKEIPGVRSVSNYVVELAPEQSVIDISSQYTVTGYSNQGNANVNVVINGRILSRGDTLDGMTISSIKPTAVFLEKEGMKYRIDYNK